MKKIYVLNRPLKRVASCLSVKLYFKNLEPYWMILQNLSLPSRINKKK